jgi:hypothetical protein
MCCIKKVKIESHGSPRRRQYFLARLGVNFSFPALWLAESENVNKCADWSSTKSALVPTDWTLVLPTTLCSRYYSDWTLVLPTTLCSRYYYVLYVVSSTLWSWWQCNIWFSSYLTDRKFQVSVDNRVVSGVAQGSISGPLLFILYMTDLPLHLNDTEIDLYADDATQYLDITYRMWNINWIVICNQWWSGQKTTGW